MAETKNLCAQIPIALHSQVCEAREQSGLTTAEYITNLLIEYFEMKGNGGKTIIVGIASFWQLIFVGYRDSFLLNNRVLL